MSNPHMTSASNLPSWLTMAAQIYPPQQVALVGAGNGTGLLVQWLQNWTNDAGQGAPAVTLLEPRGEALALLPALEQAGALAAAGLKGSDFIKGWKRREEPLDIGFVDESSMLDERALDDLREIFPALVLFGDPAQLAPVGLSGEMVFDRLGEGRKLTLTSDGLRLFSTVSRSFGAIAETVDDISAEARRVRLDLEKLVKARKDSIRGEIVAEAVKVMQVLDLPFETETALAIITQNLGAGHRDEADRVARAALASGTWMFRLALRQTAFRLRFDSACLRLPMIGRLARGYNSARFASTLAMLTAAGVPILKALQAAADTLSNQALRADALEALVRVREGAPLGTALAQNARFPGLLSMFARLGEQTGQLPVMLQRAAQQLSSEVQRRAMALATVLEPLLIVAMGGMVMLIVLAVLMPIMELNQWVK